MEILNIHYVYKFKEKCLGFKASSGLSEVGDFREKQ